MYNKKWFIVVFFNFPDGTGGYELDNIRSVAIPENVTETLRGELPVLRAKARVSQEELAKVTGISRQTYSSIERGNRNMSITVFWALIAYFQNNATTKSMLESIGSINEGISYAISQTKEIE